MLTAVTLLHELEHNVVSLNPILNIELWESK